MFDGKKWQVEERKREFRLGSILPMSILKIDYNNIKFYWLDQYNCCGWVGVLCVCAWNVEFKLREVILFKGIA